MTFKDDNRSRLEEELTQFRRDLEPLENQAMLIRGRHGHFGEWVDMTQHWIEHLKKVIATYEAILARDPKSPATGQRPQSE